jgi:hypothetical protein
MNENYFYTLDFYHHYHSFLINPKYKKNDYLLLTFEWRFSADFFLIDKVQKKKKYKIKSSKNLILKIRGYL